MKGYKFTDKKQSRMGMASTFLGAISVALIGYGINVSFNADGKAGTLVGVLALASFVISAIGVVLGIRSFKDDDVFYIFCWIGTIVNILAFVFCLSMFLIGV